MYSNDTSFKTPSATNNSSKKPKKRLTKRWWFRILVTLLFIFLVLVVAVSFYVFKVANLLQTGQVTPEDLFGQNVPTGLGKDVNFLATTDDPSFGNPDADIVIVEFSDFACPACYKAHQVINEIKKDYSDRVYFVFRNFPLVQNNEQSLIAAMASECAHEQGRFWEMHDKLFDNQGSISPEQVKIFAVQIGLNNLDFNSCLENGKYFEEIEADFQQGYNVGVKATPTFFVNGVKIEGAIPLVTFEKIITYQTD